ncbi:hypothetical protein LCGC14_2034620 [marine sediment metagenome]|uniref:Uncharacterized protein n=1 Tax=marine sediment metagenome TaxID=412755 RepID=A0A0F9HQN6_9ZZZZ
MNVFKIHSGIRKVGYGYGMPVWFVDCGLGVNYTPEDLLRKLATMGLKEKDWVVIRGGTKEKGVGTFVDALGYVHCKVEVEARGSNQTPGWFNKADRWTVYWDGNKAFNFTALRKGQDILIVESEELDEFLTELGGNDLIDKGLILNGQVDLDKVMKYKVRVYEKDVND